MEDLRFIEKTAEFEYLDYDIVADYTDDCKPLGENEGRIGYFQEAKERKEPVFTVGRYDSNQRPVRLPRYGLTLYGRKAPTATELRAQWQEQQRHEAEIRQRFTTAEQL